jgi:hypothetical protein
MRVPALSRMRIPVAILPGPNAVLARHFSWAAFPGDVRAVTRCRSNIFPSLQWQNTY